jgi:hypothetical protein
MSTPPSRRYRAFSSSAALRAGARVAQRRPYRNSRSHTPHFRAQFAMIAESQSELPALLVALRRALERENRRSADQGHKLPDADVVWITSEPSPQRY